MTITRVGVAIQIPHKHVTCMHEMAKQINTDGVLHRFMDNVDFVVNDFNSMLADCLTEYFLDRPGHFCDAIENYQDTVRMLFENEDSRRNSYDADLAQRRADEYLAAAVDFAHDIIRSDQLEPLRDKLGSIKEKEHIIIVPARLVMHDNSGLYLTSYDLTPMDEAWVQNREAF